MIDKDIEICACNSLSAGDIATCIKENNFTTMQEILENKIYPMGDKCKSCQDEGINNDGLNIPLVLSLVKRSQL